MANKPSQRTEPRICPQCERIQPHIIVDEKKEDKKYVMNWIEETCTVCNAKRIVTNPHRKYIG
jgi:hypothetical protein